MNRRQIILGSVVGLSASAAAAWLLSRSARAESIKGIVWQVDNATVDIAGNWHELGIRELLVQWSVVDDLAFVPGTGLPLAPRLPDWRTIARQPWAERVIMGLAGRFDETAARQQIDRLAEISEAILSAPIPVNVAGWYFPVEADPTWSEAKRLAPILSRLPGPLWISVYDNTNIGAKPMADWLDSWLPRNIGVFFQDGVGVQARESSVARMYADTLAEKLGRQRLRIITEAFRPGAENGFRPATLAELIPQIEVMKGHDLYLFDGPHYLNEEKVAALARLLEITGIRHDTLPKWRLF